MDFNRPHRIFLSVMAGLFVQATGDYIPSQVCFFWVTDLKHSKFLTELENVALENPSRVILSMYSWQQPGYRDIFYIIYTVAALRRHRIVLWGKHGVMARSDVSVKRASDRIEYAETGARYEHMNLMANEQGEGLSPEEIRIICQANHVEQTIF